MHNLTHNAKYYGRLVIGELLDEKNVICQIDGDNLFKNNQGKFVVHGLRARFINNHEPGVKFIYYVGDSKKYYGRIWGYSLKTEYDHRVDYLDFIFDEYELDVDWRDSTPTELNISYKIPFLYFFAKNYNYYFKNVSDEDFEKGIRFKFEYNNYLISILEYENVNDINKKEYTVTKENIINIKYFSDEINDYKLGEVHKIINDFTILLSFLFRHRIRSSHYEYKIYDKNNELVKTYEKVDFSITVGDDLLIESYNNDFKIKFTPDNINNLLRLFSEHPQKEEIRKIIFKYLTIGETSLIEVQFLSAFIVLESICKIIVMPDSHIKTDMLLKNAIEKSELNIEDFNFIYFNEEDKSNNSEIKNMLFYVYRNDLIHFNSLNIEFQNIISEFQKLMLLNRKLLFFAISPQLRDFPVPYGKY